MIIMSSSNKLLHIILLNYTPKPFPVITSSIDENRMKIFKEVFEIIANIDIYKQEDAAEDFDLYIICKDM